jgi:hypothetical protein
MRFGSSGNGPFTMMGDFPVFAPTQGAAAAPLRGRLAAP